MILREVTRSAFPVGACFCLMLLSGCGKSPSAPEKDTPLDPYGANATENQLGLSLAVRPGSVVLWWRAPLEVDPVGYRIYRGVDDSVHLFVRVAPAETLRTFVDTDVRPGHTYYYKIAPVVRGLEGAQSPRRPLLAPVPSVEIEGGAPTTQRCTVSLTLLAPRADSVFLSGTPERGAGAFEPMVATRAWALTPGQGPLRVYAWFHYPDGIVAAASDSVMPAPLIGGVLLINGGQSTTASRRVRLQVQGLVADSMLVANRPDFAGSSWEPFATTSDWMLKPDPGRQRVYVRIKNCLGVVSETLFDTIDPSQIAQVSVTIAEDSAYVSVRSVALALSAVGADSVILANDDSLFTGAQWEPLASPRLWTLTQGEGPKTVFARFRNDFGSQSPLVWDSTVADYSPPQASLTVSPPDSGALFAVSAATSTDSWCPPSKLQVRWRWEGEGSFDTAWSPRKDTTHVFASSGVKRVSVEVRDMSGHISAAGHNVDSNARTLGDGFESGLGMWSISTAGNVPYALDTLSHSGRYALKIGPSNCGINCFDSYTVRLRSASPQSVHVARVTASLYEYGNWGGWVACLIDGTEVAWWSPRDPGDPTQPGWVAESYAPLAATTARTVEFYFRDLTDSDPLYLDDVLIIYSP